MAAITTGSLAVSGSRRSCVEDPSRRSRQQVDVEAEAAGEAVGGLLGLGQQVAQAGRQPGLPELLGDAAVVGAQTRGADGVGEDRQPPGGGRHHAFEAVRGAVCEDRLASR